MADAGLLGLEFEGVTILTTITIHITIPTTATTTITITVTRFGRSMLRIIACRGLYRVYVCARFGV